MEGSIQSFSGEEKTVSTGNKNLWLLNVLRGVSAILIVLYHYTVQYDKSIGHIVPYTFTVPWGCYAVYTFFMLSGFLTVYTCKENITVSRFLKKRFFRLYPMFWICMTVTALYMFILMPERMPSLKQFLVNLTMMPSLFGIDAVDGVYWTLVKELFFYIGFAIILWLGLIKGGKTGWLWGWLGISLFSVIYSYGPVHFPFRGSVSLVLMPEYIYAFLVGCSVYYFNVSKDLKNKIVFVGYMMSCIVLCFYMKSGQVAMFFTVSLGTLIVCSQKRINEWIYPVKRVLTPILIVSEISYELYLTHQFIGFGIIRMMERYGLIAEVWVLLPIAHAIFLAIVLHYGIEVKINRKLKQFNEKINKCKISA